MPLKEGRSKAEEETAEAKTLRSSLTTKTPRNPSQTNHLLSALLFPSLYTVLF
jgi:hypothetical protein